MPDRNLGEVVEDFDECLLMFGRASFSRYVFGEVVNMGLQKS